MATPFEQYSSLRDKYKKSLQKSPTAYAPNVKPTASDVELQRQMFQAGSKAEAINQEKLRTAWYGPTATTSAEESPQPKSSYFEGVLKTLSAPLSAVAGTAEWALGKGSEKGLLKNIAANVEEQGTFGDILRSYGISNLLAMPIGLALDFALDPLMWATGGAQALVPRTFLGAVKGAQTGKGILEGAALGAKSGLLKTAEKIGRAIPTLEKAAFETKSTSWFPSAYRNLSAAAAKSVGEFDTMTGRTLASRLQESSTKTRFFDEIENRLAQKPWGQALIKGFKYSPRELTEAQHAADLASKPAGEQLLAAAKGKSGVDLLKDFGEGRVIEKNIMEGFETMNSKNVVRATDAVGWNEGMAAEAVKDVAYKQDIQREIDYITKDLLKNSPKVAEKIGSMTDAERVQLASMMKYERSDIKWMDKIYAKILTSPGGLKTLRSYAWINSFFKGAKTFGTPATYVNNFSSNIFMTPMVGIDIADAQFAKNMKLAWKVTRGDRLGIQEMLKEPEIKRYLTTYPTAFESNVGVNPEVLLKDAGWLKGIEEKMIASGKLNPADAKTYSKAYLEAVSKATSEGASITAGVLERNVQSTSYLAREYLAGPMGETIKRLAVEKEKGNPFAALAHWYLTNPGEAYGKIDQNAKLSSWIHLVKDGISRDAVETIARRIPLAEKDVIQIPGRNYYKLSPEKAMVVANEAYMNYMAMPGFVQIMRQLPLVGSPFIAFAYGAAANTAKTALYNPSVFNKIQFLLSEISGNRSPLEKEALDQKYSSWLKSPGIINLPFFQENPLYLNLAQKIPYYSLNIFQPSERSYESRFGSIVGGIIDKIPMFKQPEGQVFFDYVVLPLIIDEQAKGMFNQPLWTQGAGFPEKAGRAALSLAESVVPGAVGYAGLVTPERLAPYLPIGYQGRKLAFAKTGKTTLGLQTKEDPTAKMAKVLSAMAGWPVYSVNLKYAKPKKK